ncbi:hypothetical protein BJ138DRAFT_1113885 [Hygrophoropsis aurantiaca]|uniref:Uncharacterized protein n=1 Tax=Hygrophoropsis aurantiaca TaxID=72124 RepID=A0ACB8ABP6_9AGAM|nr:hypothetical protein BJ138DRAFT_1113885 [Hygrophoropsis aurantiaca]
MAVSSAGSGRHRKNPYHRELNAKFLRRGYTKDQLPELRKDWDKKQDECLRRAGGSFRVIEPKLGDPSEVLFPIPNSQYAIRIWDGGMEKSSQFLLDYFDIEKEVPVDTPRGYEIHPVPMPGLTWCGIPRSYEFAFGKRPDEIPDGEEKYLIPEGGRFRLVRDGHPDFFFVVPSRLDRMGVQFATGIRRS